MKKVIAISLISLFSGGGYAAAQGVDYINPYTRRDGTYVPGHNRTMPNSTMSDNWTTRGNTNPYTGERGYRDPTPSYGSSGFGGSQQRGTYGSSGRSPGWR